MSMKSEILNLRTLTQEQADEVLGRWMGRIKNLWGCYVRTYDYRANILARNMMKRFFVLKDKYVQVFLSKPKNKCELVFGSLSI